ncbi:MAG: D-glycero-alpha-D-manno-heptose-7-phosphate kinase [Bacteroidetes bacterium]|nr:MAG: D-glycero-alpha-D-manno-heptose-7-phosphate kinase [Bacteroidota bacterium]
MIVRSKAPLRIGLAGGGTDVSPYSELFGGAILNATIDLYAYASLEPQKGNKITFVIDGTDRSLELDVAEQLPVTEGFELFTGVYNRVIRQFGKTPFAFTLTSHIEAPQGSGLGTSSTIVVSLLGAFVEYFKLPLGKYDIAHLAYEIERVDLNMSGGKQDQYAATFGGINYLEFFANDRVIVNPLVLKPEVHYEMEMCLLLYFTQTQRLSADIINAQVKNVEDKNEQAIEAMHKLKEQAHLMKEYLLRGELDKIGEVLHFGWQNKKQMAKSISNSFIDDIYESALAAGATGGKISGAGGGGFMFFYCPGVTKVKTAKALERFGGQVQHFAFTQQGLTTWTI